MSNLRPATNADCAQVQSLVFGVLREFGLQADPATTDADLFDIEGHYAARGGCFDVLEDEAGAIIGSVGISPGELGSCELRKMYLRPDQRGKGFGKVLLEHGLKTAKDMGFREVHLETAAVLKDAVAMYERRGFELYTPQHCAARCDAAYRLEL